MYIESTCSSVTLPEWENLMAGAKKASYKKLVKAIKQELPELYQDLALNFPNPYSGETAQTKTHYILVHSAIEYFIKKEG